MEESDRLLDIGAEAYRQGDYRKAKKYYEESAKLGNTQAACNLGYIYEYGRTGEKNHEKAFDWFKKSADNNNANAAYKVGDAYFYGDGVPRNDSLAFQYYSQASSIARSSNGRDDDIKSDIYYRIALCLHVGRGVDQNDLLALRYINEAEYYSYCDRFKKKFMWQSIAKRIEKLRSEILRNLQSY
ncbi:MULTISPECIES: tetratricopeptide repeat protein [Lactobacillus]|uniref:tetratricopeptide repeat protein n=1 Tax=Lactobacillus TaxID=1578 RepID=UPI000CD93452|nr:MULTISPECIES: tetratricopeptide repeat protein [Lactobacillus]RVU73113.1 sel1 repeat family protein [Lactobacillus xujianguonis]